MAWRALMSSEREMLLSLSASEVARIDSADDRALIKNTVRLIDNPRLTVSDSDMRRIEALVNGVIRRPPSPPRSRPRPKPQPEPEPDPDPDRVLELVDPPRGVTRGMLYDYLDALDALYLEAKRTERPENLAVVRKSLSHDARKFFYTQKLDVRSVTGLLPTKWDDGWKRWVVCRVGITDHFVQRWHQRAEQRLEAVVPALAAAVPAPAEGLLALGLGWRLIASVIVHPDAYDRLRISKKGPGLALRTERGLIILQAAVRKGRFAGYTAATYIGDVPEGPHVSPGYALPPEPVTVSLPDASDFPLGDSLSWVSDFLT